MSNWKTVPFSSIADFKNGLNFKSGEVGHELKVLRVGDFKNRLRLDQVKEISSIHTEKEIDNSYHLQDGDLVFVRSNGNKTLVGRCMLIYCRGEEISFSGFTIRARLTSECVKPEFINLLMEEGILKKVLKRDGCGTNISNLNQVMLSKLQIPLPNIDEQSNILDFFCGWDVAIEKTKTLIAAKERQFDWLKYKRLKNAEQHPDTKMVPLGELLDYEQPTRYIVKSTDYTKNGFTPVLTANKSFILGYTNENEGIFDKPPVIIFDDFTTDSKYVNFPFKVKSSAMKILLAKNDKIDMRYIYAIMSFTKLPLGGHKRYWISEYQCLDIPLPVLEVQREIASFLDIAHQEINLLKKLVEQYRTQKRGLMQKLLSGEWKMKR